MLAVLPAVYLRGSEQPVSKTTQIFKAIPQTTLRRLRNTPSYFFLIWRWTFWFFALIDIVTTPTLKFGPLLLGITFLQTVIATLYAPVFQIFLPRLPFFDKSRFAQQHKETLRKRQRRLVWGRRRPRPLAEDEEADILTSLGRTRKPYWNLIIYGMDVLICGLATYFGGPWGTPFFGYSSPFYRYGFSAIFAAAFAYRYRGGLAAVLVYELFILLGILFPAPGAPAHLVVQVNNIIGSFLDAPLAAILAAYMATLLGSYTRSKRREQDNARRRRALLSVSDTLLKGASDRQNLLQHSAEQIRKGGHFGRLVLALVTNSTKSENDNGQAAQTEIDTYIEVGVVSRGVSLPPPSLSPKGVSLPPPSLSPKGASLPPSVPPPLDESKALFERVIQSGEKLLSFKRLSGESDGDSKGPRGIARLYLPFLKDGQLYMVLGAESIRQTPFEERQQEFLAIAGAQLLIALENVRLTEQAAELAAAAERGRIAREIHDGIAQLIYMLSLNIETCVALAQRIEEASDEDAEVLHPLTERLEKLVTISKQALWETRHYMFSLKPLISGTTTLTQMLTNQLHEFEAISGLPVHFEVEGNEEIPNGDQRRTRMVVQVGTAIFRITQEALTNAYKHAGATWIQVRLRHLPRSVEIEICDNGHGLEALQCQRIYSGRGMRGMRERTEELGGTFEVGQAPGGGVSIRACIPR
jgi:signal transduction histidine kinase